MAEPPPRSVRDDLAALRIDRAVGGAAASPRWRNLALLAAGAVGLVLLAFLVHHMLQPGAQPVRVFPARVSSGGSEKGETLLTGSGYIVTGDRYISLGVRVMGRIEKYLVEEGQTVQAGDPLVQLDDRQYAASLLEARAAEREARATAELRWKELARVRELRSRDFAAQSDLDLRENEVRVAEARAERSAARVSQLELDLEDTVVRAPTNGVILEKFKEVGETAVPGGFAGSGELIRLANLDDLRTEVEISEAELARVHMGQEARITPDAYLESHYAARVVKIYPQINRQKGTLRVELKLDAPDERLRPDMSVRVAFLSEPAAEAVTPVVLAPRDAVRRDASGSFVWRVDGDRSIRQAIETDGRAQGDEMVVSTGLSGGELLVVGDPVGLSDGGKVRVAP